MEKWTIPVSPLPEKLEPTGRVGTFFNKGLNQKTTSLSYVLHFDEHGNTQGASEPYATKETKELDNAVCMMGNLHAADDVGTMANLASAMSCNNLKILAGQAWKIFEQGIHQYGFGAGNVDEIEIVIFPGLILFLPHDIIQICDTICGARSLKEHEVLPKLCRAYRMTPTSNHEDLQNIQTFVKPAIARIAYKFGIEDINANIDYAILT